jgi:hypothetical protein
MRTTRALIAPALLACGAMLAVSVALTACGSGSASGRGGAGTAGAGTPDASTEAIVQCYRTHGDPTFPDPVYDPNDGRWHFAVSPGSAPASTQQACRRLFPSATQSQPVPQAQFQQLVQLADCMRHHGVPNWPDPDPDGSFPLPPALQTKTPTDAAALRACGQYVPSGGINAHAVS